MQATLSRDLLELMRRTEGSAEFNDFCIPDIWNPDAPTSVFFQIVAGAQFFRLERTPSFEVSFYHSSPGTGTRVATVDLRHAIRAEKMFVAFSWSPKEINLFVGPKALGGNLIHGKGAISSRAFLIDENGGVIEVGSEGVETMGLRIEQDGVSVLRPTALDTWRQTKIGVEVLLNGSSNDGYIFDVVTSNLSISALVTGFEAYCKTRFVEIQREGITADLEELDKLLPKKERNPEEAKACSRNPHDALRFLQRAAGYINFQNFRKCRDAYLNAYSVDFSRIGATADQLQEVRTLIQHRHRVIHISPLLGTVIARSGVIEKPVFINKALVTKGLGAFGTFIASLHEATLALKRTD